MQAEIEKPFKSQNKYFSLLPNRYHLGNWLWCYQCCCYRKKDERKRHESAKALICLVSDCIVNHFIQGGSEVAHDILKYAKPTTIIYDQPIRVAENLVAEDQPSSYTGHQRRFCKKLIQNWSALWSLVGQY